MKGRAVAVVVTAMLCVGIAMAAPAAADVTDVSGSGAYGESVNVSVLGAGTVTSGPTPTVTLPSGGGGPVTDSLANVNLPGVLTTGLLNVSTQGSNLGSHNGTSTSSAQVNGTTLLSALAPSLGGDPLLTADVISSQCTSNGDGSSGSSNLVGLEIAGNGGAVSPPPNTTIDVLGAISVTLNEQIVNNSPGETSITVNAVHVRLNLDGVASGDVILSQSRCRAAGPDVLGGPPGGGGPGGPGGAAGPGGPGSAAPATPVTANPNLTG